MLSKPLLCRMENRREHFASELGLLELFGIYAGIILAVVINELSHTAALNMGISLA